MDDSTDRAVNGAWRKWLLDSSISSRALAFVFVVTGLIASKSRRAAPIDRRTIELYTGMDHKSWPLAEAAKCGVVQVSPGTPGLVVDGHGFAAVWSLASPSATDDLDLCVDYFADSDEGHFAPTTECVPTDLSVQEEQVMRISSASIQKEQNINCGGEVALHGVARDGGYPGLGEVVVEVDFTAGDEPPVAALGPSCVAAWARVSSPTDLAWDACGGYRFDVWRLAQVLGPFEVALDRGFIERLLGVPKRKADKIRSAMRRAYLLDGNLWVGPRLVNYEGAYLPTGSSASADRLRQRYRREDEKFLATLDPFAQRMAMFRRQLPAMIAFAKEVHAEEAVALLSRLGNDAALETFLRGEPLEEAKKWPWKGDAESPFGRTIAPST